MEPRERSEFTRGVVVEGESVLEFVVERQPGRPKKRQRVTVSFDPDEVRGVIIRVTDAALTPTTDLRH